MRWAGCAIGWLVLGWLALAAAAAPPAPHVIVAGGAGSVVPITHWRIQSTANAPEAGARVSLQGYTTKAWYRVSGTATVMAGLLENGKYPDVFFGDNLRGVQVPDTDHHRFQIPWWYRTTFELPAGSPQLHTFIRINGIIPRADVWLNGKQVATRDEVAGAYTTHLLDVSGAVHPGGNVLALRVQPASPQRDLAIGWIDWNPAPPDNNMGVWRAIDIVRSGPVALHGLHVLSTLALPGMQQASLTVKVVVRNDDAVAEDATVRGEVAGVTLQRRVHLAAHQSQALVFDPASDPGLRLAQPKVWWPVGMGAHPLYQATMTVTVDGKLSDRAATTFGIRDVTSRLTPQGYRQFVVNGEPLLIRGAGWAPDMFLRDQPQRLAAQFRYIQNLGLNAIRTEGKLERKDFYDLADRDGILILAGWECCDKWEAWAKTGGEPWDAADFKVAGASMASEARRLRDHPSVIAFLIGSDNAPPPTVAKIYVAALRAADWPDPIISAASAQKTDLLGASGMKMSGPYGWVPPDYWYATQQGGAFGFNSETSAGVSMPRVASLRAMLTPRDLAALWQDPEAKQFHAAPFWSHFSSLAAFDTALAQRYGAPKSLDDYVEKAELMNYANVRAQFEAYSARMDAPNPATGVIYWMLSNGWPSLHWHLFGYDLAPAGAYFGAQKANEPIHIQYSYDNRAVLAVNHTRQPANGLTASIRVFDLAGHVLYSRRLPDIDLPANRARELATIPARPKLSGVRFVELELTAADQRLVSRNVYWLSSQPDTFEWAKSNWYTTPVARHADFTALQKLPPASIRVSSHTQRDGADAVTTVTLVAARDSRAVALFLHASIQQADGQPVAPIIWSSNDVTLWPGETMTLTARYAAADAGAAPVVQVQGWNIAQQRLQIK